MWLSNLSKDQHQALIRLAHNVIVSDGLLDPNEEGMFDLMKKEMGIENSEEVEYLSLDGIETTFPDRKTCLLYTSPSPRDRTRSRMPSSA